MCIKKDEKIKFNNAKEVLEKIKKENFLMEIPYMEMKGSYSELNITSENIKNNAKFIAEMFDNVKIKEPEVIDHIDKMINQIRTASSDIEARKLFLENFKTLLLSEEIKYLINDSNIEGPNDDYYYDLHDIETEEFIKKLSML